MDMARALSAEDLFVQMSDLVTGQQLTPDAAMALAAQSLCLMAVAWRPAGMPSTEAHRYVVALVHEWMLRMERHPFAAGGAAH